MVLVLAAAWEVGALVMGSARHPGRVVLGALEGVGAALVLERALGPRHPLGGQGVRRDLRPAHLGRHGTDVGGGGPLRHRARRPAHRWCWLLVISAVLPLMSGQGTRLALGGAPVGRRARPLRGPGPAHLARRPRSFTPSESVVLVPAALAVAACIGLGISAFEHDLAGRVFGWRQVVTWPRWSSWWSACCRWRSPRSGDAGVCRPRGRATPGLLEPAVDPGRGPGAVARRPPGPADRRLVHRTRSGLFADTRGPPRHRAGPGPGRSRTGRPGGQRRGAGESRAAPCTWGGCWPRPVCATSW